MVGRYRCQMHQVPVAKLCQSHQNATGETKAQSQISPVIFIIPLPGLRTSPRWQPFCTGLQPLVLHMNCPDACGFDGEASTFARSGKSPFPFGASRFAVGFLISIFSQVLSSPTSYPGRQVIFIQCSPSALNPWSQISGQMRAGLLLTASSASALATFTSSVMPAC